MSLNPRPAIGHTHPRPVIEQLNGIVPAGGAINYVLKKASAADYDYGWAAESGGGGGDGTPSLIGQASFNSGTGAITGLVMAGIISSVTRVSAGKYAVVFSSAQPDVNYTAHMTASDDNADPVFCYYSGLSADYTVNGFTFFVFGSGVPKDQEVVRVSIFRYVVPSAGGGDDEAKRFPWDVLPTVPSAQDDPFTAATVDAKWATVGGAGLTTVQKRGWLFMRATPTGASFDCRGIEQVLPAGNFSCLTIMLLMANQYSIPAIHIRNTTTNAMVRWAMFHNSGSTSDSWIGVHRYNSLTNRTAIIAQTGFGLYEAAMRITNDGTNFRFDWSRDGYKWFNYVTEAVGTSFGAGMPDRIGLSLDPVSATLEGLAAFQAFRYSATATDGIGAFA